MTTIERIGQYTIAQHGAVTIVIDRASRSHETFASGRAAREAVLERVDMVDFYEATSAIASIASRHVN